jgi:hypothetical protein
MPSVYWHPKAASAARRDLEHPGPSGHWIPSTSYRSAGVAVRAAGLVPMQPAAIGATQDAWTAFGRWVLVPTSRSLIVPTADSPRVCVAMLPSLSRPHFRS